MPADDSPDYGSIVDQNIWQNLTSASAQQLQDQMVAANPAPSPPMFQPYQIPPVFGARPGVAPSGGGMPSGAGNPGGDLINQLVAGFNAVGRKDLAAMVNTPDFRTWINAESGWNPSEVGPTNQWSGGTGHGPAGLFQFLGHSWENPYFQGGRFTMSPFQQAEMAATQFKLTPAEIHNWANQVRSHTYRGWG